MFLVNRLVLLFGGFCMHLHVHIWLLSLWAGVETLLLLMSFYPPKFYFYSCLCSLLGAPLDGVRTSAIGQMTESHHVKLSVMSALNFTLWSFFSQRRFVWGPFLSHTLKTGPSVFIWDYLCFPVLPRDTFTGYGACDCDISFLLTLEVSWAAHFSHPSKQAPPCLASEMGWDWACSRWCGVDQAAHVCPPWLQGISLSFCQCCSSARDSSPLSSCF